MLLSLRWLQEFVDIPLPVNDLAHKLTMSGFEIEKIEEIGPQWDHIIVAEVLASSQHPDADKLTINTVHTGDQTLQVVCGAPNVCSGQKVALALPGASFPNGLVIKRSKIRGQISEGMLCSAAELSIGAPDGGILVLNDRLTVGVPLADALDLRDTVLDVSITPNRSDCLSVIGMAREVAALLDAPLHFPTVTLPESGPAITDQIAINIQAPDACPRYCAGYAYDITIKASPLWMRQRLENCGIRSINNIVDITNYVLLEWGQPLHAFDYNSLNGACIVVRQSETAETFTTLDNTTHTLPLCALMICDAEQPKALAGIMGGLDSSITAETHTVLLESAYFNPSTIARTGRALGIKTEASQRFEKGVDPNSVIPALKRAAALIVELEAGSVAAGLIDHYPAPLSEKPPIHVRVSCINKTLGLDLDADTITRYLTRLHMRVTPNGLDILKVTPPSHRYDIYSQIDIIEEIARMNGYDTIPVTYPLMSLAVPLPNLTRTVSAKAKKLLTSAGFNEVINYSFQDPELLAALRFGVADERRKPIQLLNPISAAQSVMRTTILGSLLQNLQHNVHSNRCASLAVFELSNVFLNNQEAIISEKRMLAGLAYGVRHMNTWAVPNRTVDIFDIKGCIALLLNGLNIADFRFETGSDEPFLTPGTGIRVYIGNIYCGVCGTMHPGIAERFDADKPVHVFELDFDLLCTYYSDKKTYTTFSRFPAVQRDLALVIDQSVTASDVSAAIAATKNKILKQWHIFDFYQGGSIPAGKKSIAYRLTFQSDERTLTDNEVNKIHDSLLESLRKQLGAELR
jgi:phenylalanyl-tRNA synthetase beta chain